MKKYFFGMLALVLAVGFSAFTKPAVTYDFQIKSTVDRTSASALETLSSWELSSSESCSADQEKACQITVDALYTHLDAGSNRILNTQAYVLSTPSSSDNNDYVTINAEASGFGSYQKIVTTSPSFHVQSPVNTVINP